MQFRRLAIALVLFVASAQNTSDFDYRLEAFLKPFDRFIRAYYGCPEKARDYTECLPANRFIDNRAFERSKKAARDLFR